MFLSLPGGFMCSHWNESVLEKVRARESLLNLIRTFRKQFSQGGHPRSRTEGSWRGSGQRKPRKQVWATCWRLLTQKGRRKFGQQPEGLAGSRKKTFYSYFKQMRADPVGRWEGCPENRRKWSSSEKVTIAGIKSWISERKETGNNVRTVKGVIQWFYGS